MGKYGKKHEGRAWVEDGWREVYNAREIRRGRHKGKLEVEFRRSATKWRKAIIQKDDLQESLFCEEKKFDYDNPCPICKKWLFHDEASPDCPNSRES